MTTDKLAAPDSTSAAPTIGAASPLSQEIGRGQKLTARFGADRILWLVLSAIVFSVVILPLFYSLNSAFYTETEVGLSSERSLQAFLNVYLPGEYTWLLLASLMLALIVTLLSLVVGVAMALLIARTDLPGKSWLDILIIMPLFISPFTGMIAWVALGSERTGFINVAIQSVLNTVGINLPPLVNIWGFTGIVFVMVVFFCPFVYLFTVGNLRSMDSSLEEAARAHGASSLQTLWRITLPMISPAVVAAGLLIFILAAEMYTIPRILGSPTGFDTLATKIYTDSTYYPVRQAHAAASATLLLVVTIVGVWLQRRSTQKAERFITVSGKGFGGRLQALGKWRWAAMALVATYVLLADVLPFGALVLSSLMKYSAPMISADVFTLKHYQDIIAIPSMRRALFNTVLLAILSASACVVVGLVISFMELRRPGPSTKFLAFLGVMPVAVPGLVYGIGLLWALVQTPIYGTIWVLMLAYLAKFLPYGIVISRTGLLQIHPELEQSARTSGANGLTTLRRITMPLVKPTLVAVFFFVMLQSIKELSASVLLYSHKSEVLSVLTWQYMDAGNYQFAAAIGVVQTILVIGLVVITRFIFSVRLERAMSR